MRIQLTDGNSYEVAHDFQNGRAIIIYEGLYVLVDRIQDGRFELSGEPARDSEKPVLNALVATVETKVTVTKDD